MCRASRRAGECSSRCRVAGVYGGGQPARTTRGARRDGPPRGATPGLCQLVPPVWAGPGRDDHGRHATRRASGFIPPLQAVRRAPAGHVCRNARSDDRLLAFRPGLRSQPGDEDRPAVYDGAQPFLPASGTRRAAPAPRDGPPRDGAPPRGRCRASASGRGRLALVERAPRVQRRGGGGKRRRRGAARAAGRPAAGPGRASHRPRRGRRRGAGTVHALVAPRAVGLALAQDVSARDCRGVGLFCGAGRWGVGLASPPGPLSHVERGCAAATGRWSLPLPAGEGRGEASREYRPPLWCPPRSAGGRAQRAAPLQGFGAILLTRRCFAPGYAASRRLPLCPRRRHRRTGISRRRRPVRAPRRRRSGHQVRACSSGRCRRSSAAR